MKPKYQHDDKSNSERSLSIWIRIAEAIDNRLKKFCSGLGQAFEKLSVSKKKLILVFFGVVFGGVSLLHITNPFMRGRELRSIIPTSITIPDAGLPLSSQPVISPREREMLLHFKRTLDSLRLSDPIIYNEAIKGREGLLDSINFLLTVY